MSHKTIFEIKKWSIKRVDEIDIGELLTLFEKSFGSKIEKSFWEWKYKNSLNYGFVLYEKDKAIAYYGGIDLFMARGKRRFKVSQVCDTMVDPSSRGFFTKRGAFYHIASHYIKERLKIKDFLFGFPSQRAAKLGEKLKLYKSVDGLYSLFFTPEKKTSFFYHRIVKDENIKKIERFFKKNLLKNIDKIAVVKDAEYVKHRYFNHPFKRYEILEIRCLSLVLGYVILHQQEKEIEILDIIAKPKNFQKIVEYLKIYAYKKSADVFYIWATNSIKEILSGYFKKEQVCEIVVNYEDNRYGYDYFKNSFWLMGGDTDFR